MDTLMPRRPSRALAFPESFFYPTSLFDDRDLFAKVGWEDSARFFGSELAGLEMYEEGEDLVIKTDLPGVKMEDLDLSLEGGVLSIKAEKKYEETKEDTTYYARERFYGKTSRAIKIPFAVDTEKVEATLCSGVLEIRMPKAEEAKPKRIEVKEG